MTEDAPAGPAPGAWYLRNCRAMWQRLGPSAPRQEEAGAKRRERFAAAQERNRQAVSDHEAAVTATRPGSPERKRGDRALASEEKRFDMERRRLEQPKFRKAVRFLGWDLRADQAVFFAGIAALLVFVVGLIGVAFVGLAAPGGALSVQLVAPVLLLFMPLTVFVFLVQYPETLAKRVQVLSLGRAPEAVNYLSMSMRLRPSLDRAVSFAAENLEGAMGDSLRQASWNVYVRRYSSIEKAFVALADEWGKVNEDLRRALYTLRGAALESSEEGVARTLDKANDIILAGSRQQIMHFVGGLSGPTTVLFALGVLLPITMGAALPLMSTNISFDPSQFGGGAPTMVVAPPDPVPIILMFDVVFPAIAFAYAWHILGRRPGTVVPPNIASKVTKQQRRKLAVTSAAVGVGLAALALLTLGLGAASSAAEGGGGSRLADSVGALPVLWGVAAALGLYMLGTTREQRKERARVLKLESEFPDALFQLGGRISEGNSPERAIEMTVKSMEGTEAGALLAAISFRIKVTRSTLDHALFGRGGLLVSHPSRMVRAALRILVQVSQKDSRTAGANVIQVSNYLKDLDEIDKQIRTELRGPVDNVKATAVYFAPVVMGVTVGLFAFLGRTFSSIGRGASSMIPLPIFVMIMGVYLLEMVMVVMYFSAGIEHGDDRVLRRNLTGSSLPLAALLFTVSAIGAQAMIG